MAVPGIVRARAISGAGGVRIGLDRVDQLVLEVELARIVGGARRPALTLSRPNVSTIWRTVHHIER